MKYVIVAAAGLAVVVAAWMFGALGYLVAFALGLAGGMVLGAAALRRLGRRV